jgi:hypothetical protein
VVWGFAGDMSAPPSALRHPAVQLVAPLTSSIALFAHHQEAPGPEMVLTAEVNGIVTGGAHEWIAGPTEAVVQACLSEHAFH